MLQRDLNIIVPLPAHKIVSNDFTAKLKALLLDETGRSITIFVQGKMLDLNGADTTISRYHYDSSATADNLAPFSPALGRMLTEADKDENGNYVVDGQPVADITTEWQHFFAQYNAAFDRLLEKYGTDAETVALLEGIHIPTMIKTQMEDLAALGRFEDPATKEM